MRPSATMNPLKFTKEHVQNFITAIAGVSLCGYPQSTLDEFKAHVEALMGFIENGPKVCNTTSSLEKYPRVSSKWIRARGFNYPHDTITADPMLVLAQSVVTRGSARRAYLSVVPCEACGAMNPMRNPDGRKCLGC